jgi:hypothetical protein
MPALDPWQREILESKSKRILICKGRQIGGTTVFAKKASDRLCENPNDEIMVVSITEEQAQHVIMMVLSFLEKEHKSLLSDRLQDTTKGKIILKNGSTIISKAVGQTGASVRGFTKGVLWLNEGSRLPEFVFEAAKPMLLTTDGDIWMDSTPFGRQGYFYKSFLNESGIWAVFHKNAEDVINERLISEDWTQQQREGALRLLSQEKKEMTALQYGQEYLGLFIEDLQQYFPTELIRKVMTIDRGLSTLSSVGENFLGVDVGSINDPSVLCSVQRINKEKYRMLDLETVHKALLRETTIKIKYSDEKYNYKKIYVDSTGIGLGVFQELFYETKYQNKVVAVENATRSIDREDKQKKRILKEDLYENLKWLMESRKIELFNDDEIFDSLSSVQYEIDKETRLIKIFGRNTHFAEALIRAVSVQLEKKHLNLWIA